MRQPALLCLAVLTVSLLGCDVPRNEGSCARDEDCLIGFVCSGTQCIHRNYFDAGAPDAAFALNEAGLVELPDGQLLFPDGAIATDAGCPALRACGEVCCASNETCGGERCCAFDELCGNVCCGPNQRCEGNQCVLECPADRALCGNAGSTTCCNVGQVCYLGACTDPGAACTASIDCAEGQYCEPTAGRCLPRATSTTCEYRPRVENFEMVEEWHWANDPTVLPLYDQVMMAPMVAQLTDDDGDGDRDRDDIPDVVFSTFRGSEYFRDGILRAVRGSDGQRIWPTSDPPYRVTPGGDIAIGDVHPSPGPEILACSQILDRIAETGYLLVIAADGTLLHHFDGSGGLPSVPCGFDGPIVGDLDNDGFPEVVVRYTVVQADDAPAVAAVARTFQYSIGPYTTLADLDGNGTLEIVGSNGAYVFNGPGAAMTPLWERRVDGALGPAIPDDGWVAIADLQRDGTPEVIVVTPTDHSIRALSGATGATIWGPIDINPLDDPSVAADVLADSMGDRPRNGFGGGPPTIANFDNDPEPEIAFAGGFAYVVFNHDGTRLWYRVTTDRSSRVTGSSLFDFEGDGISEVVYNDERTFHVYRGNDGMELFSRCNTSGTLREYPIVVDVDSDDHAEIIVMGNNYAYPCLDNSPSNAGIYVFGHPRNQWVRTRRIFNQHTYHVTNINEDGTVPQRETPNWTSSRLNNFRQNVQPDGLFDAPDLVLVDLQADLRLCPGEVGLQVRLVNQGAAGAPAGIPVTFYEVTTSGRNRIARVTSTRPLLPGASEVISLPTRFMIPESRINATFRFEAILNDATDMPREDVNQCNSTNDTLPPIDVACPSVG